MMLPRVKESVMIRDEGPDEAYAINLNTGDMFKLNTAARDIIQCCKDGLTVDEAYERIAAKYEEGKEKIRPDIERTVEKLREAGMVED